ncbi:PREDICTED: zinc finger protein 653-like [Nipponia nippon]|uniref:zinc finger protein 653-like n=1 Tax=Nipponia nippon TaxID=128390 RepID=UPI0005110DCB|nr:PREDICTED: zinc finger protein 653-like [Nipponia nippon]
MAGTRPVPDEGDDDEGSVQPYIVGERQGTEGDLGVRGGAQSPEQQALLARHGPAQPVFVEGPFPLWLRSTHLCYYVLRGDPLPPDLRVSLMDPGAREGTGQNLLRRRSRRGRAPHPDPEGLPEPIACPYAGCGQVYVALSSFQNHVNLVHRKGRTQQCPQPGCGKRFYLANHLRRHMVIHSGERVHLCEICGYRCRQRASLTWHMRRHGGPGLRPFPCEHCGRRFERPEGLKFHALKSHPEPRGT